MDKSTIRKHMIEKRQALDASTKQELDLALRQKVLTFLSSYNHIALFVGKQDKIDTLPLIEQLLVNKHVYLPKIINDDLAFVKITSIDQLQLGKFDVYEPIDSLAIDPKILDIAIVPLLAFDNYNNRLGYGKGYYDSILNEVKLKYGIAYEFQRVTTLPSEEHDVLLDGIIV